VTVSKTRMGQTRYTKFMTLPSSRDKVVAAVKRALDDAGIEIPFPYRTLTFNEPLPIRDQRDSTEDTGTGG